MQPYIHPVLAALTLGLLAWVASLGVRARNDRRNRAKWLRLHARVAPWMLAAVAASWVGGVVGQWLRTPVQDVGASWHFRLGAALVVVLMAAAAASRRMQDPRWRAVHPWLGAAGLMLAAGQFFFGLQILP